LTSEIRPPHDKLPPYDKLPMSPHPAWTAIALRLLLTMVAAAVIGFNRGAKGHAVGLRTTILVGPAASVAMIQARA
jgi:putative Mg2+ transporter-C (MgtC) family protein